MFSASVGKSASGTPLFVSSPPRCTSINTFKRFDFRCRGSIQLLGERHAVH